MPIYMKIEGIKGDVQSTNSGGGPRITVFDGSVNAGAGGGISVSRISIPNSPSGAIDALAPNAVVKARELFQAQRTRVISHGAIFSIPPSGANKLRHASNLRQISLAARGQVSRVRLFITDGSSHSGVAVELENCLITSYSVSGAAAAAAAAGGSTPPGTLPGEGKAVKIAFVK